MKTYLSLGSTPCDEECAQVGSPNYQTRMQVEAARYIGLLEQLFPSKPAGCRFAIKGFQHEFGTYHEVVVWFDDSVEEQAEFAYEVEGNLPASWEG